MEKTMKAIKYDGTVSGFREFIKEMKKSVGEKATAKEIGAKFGETLLWVDHRGVK